jgi:UDP:flavonoid glycosyltransferase YjiC (YdhE family)
MRDQLTATAVRDAVRAVLADDSPERAAAREIAAQIATMPSPAQVARDLNSIAEGHQAAV